MSTGSPYGDRELFHDAGVILTRVRLLLRQAFNEGIGPLLIGLLLLTGAAISGRVALTSGLEYTESVGDELQALTAINEPRRDDPYMGIIALVLAPLNAKHDSLSRMLVNQPSYARAASMRQFFLSLVREVEQEVRPVNGAPAPESQVAALADSLVLRAASNAGLTNNYFLREDDGWRRHAVEVVAEILQRRPPADLRPATSMPLSRRDSLLGRAMVRDETAWSGGTTLVPGLYASAVPDSLEGSWVIRSAPRSIDERIQSAVQCARLFDLAGKFGMRGPEETGRDSYDLFQAYFVSVDHVLDLWHRPPDGKPSGRSIAEQLPLNRYWAAASYSESLMVTNRSEYASRAYVDYAGGGVTLTLAEPLILNDHRFVGIVATDFRVPSGYFAEELAKRSRLLEVVVVEGSRVEPRMDGLRLRARRDQRLDAWFAYVTGRSLSTPGFDWAPLENRRREKELLNALMPLVTSGTVSRQVAPIAVGSEKGFLVPLCDPSDPEYRALLVIPRAPFLPSECWLSGLICILCVAGTVGSIAFGFQLTARTSELERRRGLLRGIQVGVLRTNAKEEILEANDRAEEILSRRLPKVGTSLVRGEPVRFDHLIEDEVALEVVAELDPMARELRKASFRNDVRDERRRGKVSRYLARLRDSDQIVDVTAAPVLARGGRTGEQESVGVVWIGTDNEEKETLRKRMSEAMEHPLKSQGESKGARPGEI